MEAARGSGMELCPWTVSIQAAISEPWTRLTVLATGQLGGWPFLMSAEKGGYRQVSERRAYELLQAAKTNIH